MLDYRSQAFSGQGVPARLWLQSGGFKQAPHALGGRLFVRFPGNRDKLSTHAAVLYINVRRENPTNYDDRGALPKTGTTTHHHKLRARNAPCHLDWEEMNGHGDRRVASP